MRFPAALVYVVILAIVVGTLVISGTFQTPRPELPPVERAEAVSGPSPDEADAATGVHNRTGLALPPPHPLDELATIQIGDAEDGIGTAFAINESGAWLTARHVVDGCSRVGLAVGNGRMVRVDEVRTSKNSDLALLITERAPVAMQLDLERELRVGEAGYHVGFPQGISGETASILESRSNLVTRGRYQMEEPVLAWVEKGRSEGFIGTISGMSGGPVLDDAGAVIGVTVAESSRRGTIYTASPDSIRRFLDAQGFLAPGGEARPMSSDSYAAEADRLRDAHAVVKVLCRVNHP